MEGGDILNLWTSSVPPAAQAVFCSMCNASLLNTVNPQARTCRLTPANRTQLQPNCSVMKSALGMLVPPYGPQAANEVPKGLLREMVCAVFSRPGAGWRKWELWHEQHSMHITTNFWADVVAEGSKKLLKIMLSGFLSPWAPWFMAGGKGVWEIHVQETWSTLSCFKHKTWSSLKSVMCLLLKRFMANEILWNFFSERSSSKWKD